MQQTLLGKGIHAAVLLGISLAAAPLLGPCAWAQQLPSIHARGLSGEVVAMPEAFQHKPAVLVFADSSAGLDEARTCFRSLRARGRQDSTNDVYALFDLHGTSGFLRRPSERLFARHFSSPEKEHIGFLDHPPEALRRLLVPWETDEAYIYVIDASGNVFWSYRGTCTEDGIQAIQAAVALARNQAKAD